MKIDYENMILTIGFEPVPMDEFKVWFKENYQPLLHNYHIGNGKFDWQAIFSDVQKNGIIEIFEYERTPTKVVR